MRALFSCSGWWFLAAGTLILISIASVALALIPSQQQTLNAGNGFSNPLATKGSRLFEAKHGSDEDTTSSLPHSETKSSVGQVDIQQSADTSRSGTLVVRGGDLRL